MLYIFVFCPVITKRFLVSLTVAKSVLKNILLLEYHCFLYSERKTNTNNTFSQIAIEMVVLNELRFKIYKILWTL